jgi:hypothetical protein
MHESEQKFSICKCRTIKLNESYRLVTIVLVLNTHSRQIHSIFLTTIAAAARSRYSNFWARRGSVAVGFLFLSPRCGSGALAFFFYRRGAVAVTFQPRLTSLPQADSIRKFLKSIFRFYLKALIQFCSELNSLSNGI